MGASAASNIAFASDRRTCLNGVRRNNVISLPFRHRRIKYRGGFGGGQSEAGLGGGEGCGELRMVSAEVLGGDEDVVVAGGVEPVADGGPEIARHEGIDEAQLGEGARWGDEWNKLEVGADVGRRFGVAGDFVGLVRRRIGWRLEVEELRLHFCPYLPQTSFSKCHSPFLRAPRRLRPAFFLSEAMMRCA